MKLKKDNAAIDYGIDNSIMLICSTDSQKDINSNFRNKLIKKNNYSYLNTGGNNITVYKDIVVNLKINNKHSLAYLVKNKLKSEKYLSLFKSNNISTGNCIQSG